MKILVTGSTGVIGTSIIEKCIAEKVEIRTLGRSKSKMVEDHFTWTLGMGPEPKALIGVDLIIHAAWTTKDRGSIQNHLNIGGAMKLIDSAQLANIPIINISSFAAINPSSSYGLAKKQVEALNSRGLNLRIAKVENYQKGKAPKKIVLRKLIFIPAPKNINVHVASLDEVVGEIFSHILLPIKPEIKICTYKTMSLPNYIKHFWGFRTIALPVGFLTFILRLSAITKIRLFLNVFDRWISLISISEIRNENLVH